MSATFQKICTVHVQPFLTALLAQSFIYHFGPFRTSIPDKFYRLLQDKCMKRAFLLQLICNVIVFTILTLNTVKSHISFFIQIYTNKNNLTSSRYI